MSKRDLFQEITNNIISLIESDTLPAYTKPWNAGNSALGLPSNVISNKPYTGINSVILMLVGAEFNSSQWLTYKQAVSLGGNVIRGQKGTQIVYYTMIEKTDSKGEKSTFPLLKSYTVFNVEQCENIKIKACDRVEFVPTAADDIAKKHNVKVIETNDVASYSPSTDSIKMPTKSLFVNDEAYSATLLHELAHWTGASKRLNRDFSGNFGSESYAFEELIAELTATFLSASLGIQSDIMQHAGYLKSWAKVLKSDSKAIVTAAREAQKAFDYLIGDAE